MPTPYLSPSQLLESPSLSNHFLFNYTYKANYNKFPGGKLVSISTFSLSTTNPTGTTTLQCLNLAHKKDGLCAKGVSQFIDKSGISLVEKYNGLPIKDDEPESLDLDEKASRLQVQNFVDAIRALPCNERIDILKFLEKDGGILSILDFNDLLMALLITNESDLALKLYSNASSYGLVPDSCTFGIIIRCHCKKNDVDEAKRVLDPMLEKGLNPNAATFTTLINSFCKKGQLQKAFQVFEVMGRIGCRPNVQIYNCLLKGLCYVGRVEEAFELLVDMKEAPYIEPDIYTYTAMMDGFCKVGRSDEAMELLNEALEMGLTPNVITFNTLFNGYNKEGRPVQGISVLKRMKQRNCMPDYITYSTLLHGLLLWGKIRVALRICKEMLENGYEVDERLMNGLVRGLCRKSLKENDLLEDAYELFEKMKKRVCVIDQSTHGLAVQALCAAKKVDDALVNLDKMIRLGYRPRVITINSLIRALCVEGKVEKAFLVLVLMHEHHKILTRISYDLLIHELNQQGRYLGACSVYSAALVRGVAPHEKPAR